MSIAAISPHTARTLLRIRWLAWGAIAALLATHLAIAVAQPAQPENLRLEPVVANAGEACGCTHQTETI